MRYFSLRYAAITFSVCMLVIALFTPWEITTESRQSIDQSMHSLIWKPPEIEYSPSIEPMRVDLRRLSVYLIFSVSVSVLAGTFGQKK